MSLRALTVAGVSAAVVAVALLLFHGVGGGYDVQATFTSAGQLVKGDQVKVGGVPVGKVTSIALTPDARARVGMKITDGGLTPLHRGTAAVLRSVSLAGIANHYVSLALGPNNAPKIPDGGDIGTDNTRSQVDIDQLLNALTPSTQSDIRTVLRQQAKLFSGREREANAGFHQLSPGLSQSSLTTRELIRDQDAFERFIVKSADVVATVASRPDDLRQLTANTLGTADAVARQSAALDSALARLPETLRKGNTTLVNLRASLRDIRPAIREARPGAPLLSEFLQRLAPLAGRSVPVVERLRLLLDRPQRSDDLLGLLRTSPALSSQAVPTFRSTTRTLTDAMPILRNLRPYTPDFIGGTVNGFSGTASGYYDANGHYARISIQDSLYSLNNEGSLVPLPPAQRGLTGYRKQQVRHCPGSAVEPGPDGSNPYVERSGFPCDRSEAP